METFAAGKDRKSGQSQEDMAANKWTFARDTSAMAASSGLVAAYTAVKKCYDYPECTAAMTRANGRRAAFR